MALGYRPQLDGLRAIAIGLVGVEHFGGPWVRTHFPIGAGALGVQLFFVLSGFLITRNLLFRLEQAPAGEVIRRFYFGRAVRLMSAYYPILLVLFVLGVPEVHDFILWHLTYTSNYLAATGGPLLVFWSLAVEEQFYLLLPVLILLSGRDAVRALDLRQIRDPGVWCAHRCVILCRGEGGTPSPSRSGLVVGRLDGDPYNSIGTRTRHATFWDFKQNIL